MNELFCTETNSVLLADTISWSKGNHTFSNTKGNCIWSETEMKITFCKAYNINSPTSNCIYILNDNLDTIWLTLLNPLDFFFTNIHNRHLLHCINHTVKPDNGKGEKLTRFYKQRRNINSSGSYTIWGETLWTYSLRCIFNYLLLCICQIFETSFIS